MKTVGLYGGARYKGKSERDAKAVLDSSQNGESHPDKKSGHPRGHASYPKGTGTYDSVENYSKTGNLRKTAFPSRSDQDFVAHYSLKTDEARDIMEELNDLGEKAVNNKAAKIPAKHLDVDEDDLPEVQEWHNGEKIGKPGRIKDLVMVMRHFYDKYDDPREKPFVLTFYPRL